MGYQYCFGCVPDIKRSLMLLPQEHQTTSLPVGAGRKIPIIGNATLSDDMALAIYQEKLAKFFVLILQVDGVITVGISLRSPGRSRHLGKERILSVGFHRDGNGTFFRDPSRR
jgi:hypothetical protein